MECRLCHSTLPKKPIQLTVLTLSIVIAEEVREAEVLRKDPPEQLAIPLYPNLDDEPGDDDAAAQLLRNVKEAQAPRKPPTQEPDVEVSVSAQRNRSTQEPDLILEIEDTPAARERGHVLIAIENPNTNLEVKIVHKTTGSTIGSTVRFQAI